MIENFKIWIFQIFESWWPQKLNITRSNQRMERDGGGGNDKFCVKTINIFYIIVNARTRLYGP